MPYPITIAVIDNDESIRVALRRLLQTSGYVVETFASAEDFLDHAETNGPDCLLLDDQLIGAKGLKLQQRLRAAGWRIPLVVMTSHEDPVKKAAALEGGAQDVLCKPVDVERLLNAIQKALHNM